MTPRLVAGALALASLAALAPGCRPAAVAGERYEAWEEGRTLIFENPSLPDGPPSQARSNQRFQKQVVHAVEGPAGRKVDMVYSSFQGRQGLSLLLKDGGTALLDAAGKPQTILPEGFPERTSSWQSPAYRMRVVGRAQWSRTSPQFPATRPPEGVWVEGEPTQAGAPKVRVFYLRDFGEVEKMEWRDGRWVTTNLLVGWSFQEIPRPAPHS